MLGLLARRGLGADTAAHRAPPVADPAQAPASLAPPSRPDLAAAEGDPPRATTAGRAP